ncbi:MAG: lactate dehydrogenase [Opitutae bacterium]|nr:lactate dehydrogenase [Opitutae bacterium]|tara:strand:+ start:837 stop:1931 length:1095 start_codon:yes stop_codon:yes gene_type:complete
MTESFKVVSQEIHDDLVCAAFRHRGFDEAEALAAAQFSAYATKHGIRTHNALKALHLDELFGSAVGGCAPSAKIEIKQKRFDACQTWNANKKLGQAVACSAMEACIEMADKHGSGTVVVDDAFHYLWGGGYVMDAARKGYFAYTNCTSTLAEVVPFTGKTPTLGTNPHSWGLPTCEAIGFPVVVDWATSVIAMGRVQQLKREGQELPPNAAVDDEGNPTTDPNAAASLLPFAAHKGYGLGLLNEIIGAMAGGSLPTVRGIPGEVSGEKYSCNFFFQVIHPEAFDAGSFAHGRSQAENLKTVLADILKEGNEHCLLPGQPEALFAERSEKNGGLLFSEKELDEFDEVAEECGQQKWDRSGFKTAE